MLNLYDRIQHIDEDITVILLLGVPATWR
jgi:hypothetical protein